MDRERTDPTRPDATTVSFHKQMRRHRGAAPAPWVHPAGRPFPPLPPALGKRLSPAPGPSPHSAQGLYDSAQPQASARRSSCSHLSSHQGGPLSPLPSPHPSVVPGRQRGSHPRTGNEALTSSAVCRVPGASPSGRKSVHTDRCTVYDTA